MLFTVDGLSFGYGEKTVLENVSFTLNENERVGLIGENGAGKTTFFKLITGELQPSSGDIFKKSGLRIGYLRQDAGLESDSSVYDEMAKVFAQTFRDIKRESIILESLAEYEESSAEYIRLAAEHDAVIKRIAAADGYNADVKIKTVLNGIGFSDKYNQICSTMSGGEKNRLATAKLLLECPDILLLDEPTNHLDMNALSWLESYLNSYKGGIIVVSHDRYFLDKTVNGILELEDNRITRYAGNYSKFKRVKEDIISGKLKEYEKQTVKIAAMKDYAARNIARATTSKSARSRLKQLENLEILENPITKRSKPHFNFSFLSESGKEVLTVSNMPLSVENKVLINSVNLKVFKKERIALVGANGTGKSTLIRKIYENKDFRIAFGANVRLGYYDQENLNLSSENTALEELWHRRPTAAQSDIRAVLGGLLLTKDDVYKPVSVLSGGERAKVGLAVAMLEKGNTLILDEPTNHLDLKTREALESELKSFEGTVLFVSHDRYFINALATKIIEIENGELREYPGNYDSYIAKKKEEMQSRERMAEEKKCALYKPKKTAKDRSDEVKRKLRIKELEEEIAHLEIAVKNCYEIMVSPEVAADYKLYAERENEYKELETRLEGAYNEYFGYLN